MMRRAVLCFGLVFLLLSGFVTAQPLKDVTIGCSEISIDGANIEEISGNLITLRAYKNMVTIDIISSCEEEIEFILKNMRSSSLDITGLSDYDVVSSTKISFSIQTGDDLHLEFSDKGEDIEKFQFIAMGDNRDGPETFQTILEDVDDERYAFCINTGDIVPSGRVSQFEEFMGWIEDLSIPFYISIGNHELNNNAVDLATSYVGDPDFSFDYANTHFVVINNSQSEISEEQYQWMRNDIISSDKTILVIVCHVPPYDPREGEDHCMTGDEAERFKLFAAEMGANLVLHGHVHLYDHSVFYGVDYVITAGAGAPLYAPEAKGGFFHYVICTVEEDEIKHEVVKVTSPLYTHDIAAEKLQTAHSKLEKSLENYEKLHDDIMELEDAGKDVDVLKNSLDRAKVDYDISQDLLEEANGHFFNEYYRECITSANGSYTYAEQGDIIVDRIDMEAAEMMSEKGDNTFLYFGAAAILIVAFLAAVIYSKRH